MARSRTAMVMMVRMPAAPMDREIPPDAPTSTFSTELSEHQLRVVIGEVLPTVASDENPL